jgi:small-conductance mechanosensitive channel
MHFYSSRPTSLAFRGILLLALMLVFSQAHAIDPLLSIKLGEAESKLQLIEKSLGSPDSAVDVDVLKEFQEQGLFVKQVANQCIERNEDSIKKSAGDLEILGVQTETEDPEVASKRKSLNQSMLADAQQLASCRLLLLRANEMIKNTLARQQQELANELLVRSDNLYQNFKHILLNPTQILSASLAFFETAGGLDTAWDNIWYILPLLLIALGITAIVKRWVKGFLVTHATDELKGYVSQFKMSLLSCLNRYLPSLMLSGSLSLYFIVRLYLGQPINFLALMIFGWFLYSGTALVVRFLLNPPRPAQRLTNLPEDVSLLLFKRLRLLSRLLLIGFLMFSALQIHEFPAPVTALIRNIYLFLLVSNLIWAVWLLRYYEHVSKIHFLRVLIIFGFLVCLVADWLGYTNLADFILLGIGGSLLLWAMTIFVLRLWRDFLDSLDEGRHSWQQRLRKMIGVADQGYIPGSIWFRFTFALVIWTVFSAALLKLWGVPTTTLLMVRDTITNGFEIGSVEIVPIKFIIALLSFAVMLSLIGWIKRRMGKSWLGRSHMERGSKEAMISLTGYFGAAIAFLLALTIAGVELANLALIAGALSVGIGFGLQNIVNNFVSGLILLFERPIKTGDWIVVGGTEGYVKNISIRSTQIQTFDRSDVIVPNSELISGQVTNWMFRDLIGRVVVPVGVAYGSDTKKVEQILLDIAYRQDEVIIKSPVLNKPWVLFREFGDSSLNFELRCFIRNVDQRLNVISAINFEIDQAFREAGIEIPFPQRDVHLIAKSNDDIANNDEIKSS